MLFAFVNIYSEESFYVNMFFVKNKSIYLSVSSSMYPLWCVRSNSKTLLVNYCTPHHSQLVGWCTLLVVL